MYLAPGVHCTVHMCEKYSTFDSVLCFRFNSYLRAVAIVLLIFQVYSIAEIIET